MLASLPVLGVGALLGSALTYILLQVPGWHAPLGLRTDLHQVFYANTVMQNGACHIIKEDNMSIPNPNPEFPHVIATFMSPHYGMHVMVLGKDSKLYHKHQLAIGDASNWTGWKCLTPDLTKVPCSKMPHCSGYDNNPAMAWQPVNGTLIAFVRQMDDLVPHELHLEDPKDPDSWSTIRGPTCLCNFPPCKGQVNCGVVSQCDNLGVNCDEHPSDSREYYEYGPVFPTSELVLLTNETSKKLVLYWRGFDGTMYSSEQNIAGDAGGKWGGNYTHLFNGNNATVE